MSLANCFGATNSSDKLSGKMYTFLLSALSRKMSIFYCSYLFSLRIKQKLRRMSSNTGEDVKLCGVCVLAASEKEKLKDAYVFK